ncbi:MAG: crotonase [Legionellales bacterium]|nr:crotonase [Legionellales bacterium]
MSNKNLQHWHCEIDDHRIYHWLLDRQGESVNTFIPAVLTELEQLINQLEQDQNAKGVVIRSAKGTGFALGADIHYLHSLETNQAISFVRQGQQVFDRLAQLPIPTVAVIDGLCIGGGLELALACRYRIAEQNVETRLGLPEVNLGILPGWGGSVRLPQLIGPAKALDLMVSGRLIAGHKAVRWGLVDVTVPKRQWLHAAQHYILTPIKCQQPQKLTRLLTLKPLRVVLASIVRSRLAKKIKQKFYPASYAIVDNWERYAASGTAAFNAEVESIRYLISDHRTAPNLIRLFLLREKLKAQAKQQENTWGRVHVVGAGVMGGDIAAWCALHGMWVTLQDTSHTIIAQAVQRASHLFRQKLPQPRLYKAAMDRLIPDVSGHGITTAEVIIEAVTEDLMVKQELFKTIELQARDDAVLATNTSSIPLEDIATVMRDPERLVGIHFFNPVAKMQIVEVVHGVKTQSIFLERACSWVNDLKKLPLPVKSAPGFLINRILVPYMTESLRIYEEGVPIELIDQAAKEFGMRMGPIELADAIGLDICLATLENLNKHFYGDTISPILIEKIANSELGCKTNQGFYSYRNGQRITRRVKRHQSPIPLETIANRLIMRMLNEAAVCLREGIVTDADLLDAGLVFGAGFAPFRGGVVRYANTLGIERVRDQYQQLEQHYGERFMPDKYMAELVTSIGE